MIKNDRINGFASCFGLVTLFFVSAIGLAGCGGGGGGGGAPAGSGGGAPPAASGTGGTQPRQTWNEAYQNYMNNAAFNDADVQTVLNDTEFVNNDRNNDGNPII